MNLKRCTILFYATVLLMLMSGCSVGMPTLTQSPDAVYHASEQLAPTQKISDALESNKAPDTSTSAEHNQSIVGTLQVMYLDVGQGDSIFICLPNGESMLIDAGATSVSGDVIRSITNSSDDGTIDFLIATHPHSDHIGGMAAVIECFEIGSLWMPDVVHTTKTFENLLDAIEEKDLTVQTAEAGRTLFDYGNLKAVFIAPNGNDYADINNYSAVILLTYNDFRFLFMGDAEKESEAEILNAGIDISADVLKVAHHGSASSSTQAFVQSVMPKYAVISCGKDNSYNHPAGQTIATLSALDIDVKCTDENGLVVFSCDGDTIYYDTQTETQPRTPPDNPAEPLNTNANAEGSADTQEQSVTIYVTKTGSKYHAIGCRYLSQSKISIDLELAKQNYEPCSVCSPPR